MSDHFDVFLSHNSCDKPVVERLAEKLKRAGLEPWLDKWHISGGDRFQENLAAGLRGSAACAFFIGPNGVGNWAGEELDVAQNRAAKEKAFRLFPVLLPGVPEPFDPTTLPPFLSTRMWIDIRKGIDDSRSFQLLINAIKGVAPGPDTPIAPRTDTCPYRGLQAFSEEHAEFFFGRDGDIQRLIERLKTTRFLAVLGSSGSGKSSLVRAGLIPRVKAGVLPDSDTWKIQVLTPGAHPVTALAANLLRAFPHGAMAKTVDDLTSDPRALHLACALALAERPPSELVVWVIDQFEEVFTLCRDEQERKQFLDNLLYAGAVPDGRSMVVLTMRADFYPKCAAHPDLSARIAAQQFLVSPMDFDGLRQAIEEPAWRVGLEFEEGLVATVLDDIANEPGSLPLLEHALLELWERRRGRMMTLEGYRESGGVNGAIAKRADTVYAAFDESQQQIVRRIMLRLTQPGEGTEDTRRRATISELVTSPGESEAVETVVRTMADARLLTVGAGEPSGERLVDVSHEALIRGWPRLRKWIDEDRAALRVHRRLTEAGEEWKRLNRDEGILYRGARLAQAVEWRERYEAMLNEAEREFLDASVALQAREENQQQERQKRDLEAAQKLAEQSTARLEAEAKARQEAEQRNQEQLLANRRLRKRGVALLALLVAAIALAAFAWKSQREADKEAKNAIISQRKAGEEENKAKRSSEQAKQQFSRSDFIRAADFLDQGGTAEGMAYLSRAVETRPENHAAADRIFNLLTQRRFCLPITEPLKVEGTIGAVRFTPEGACLVAVVNRKNVDVWDAQRRQVCFPPLIHDGPVHKVQFSEDGKLVGTGCSLSTGDLGTAVAGKSGGYAQIWSAQTGKPIAGRLVHVGAVWFVSFDKSCARMVTASEDKTARIWDTASGKQVGETMQHRAPVLTAEFSTDGNRIVTASGELAVWNVRNGAFICSGRDKAEASYLFSTDDFRNREAEDDEAKYREAVDFVKKLRASAKPLSQFLWSEFSGSAQQLLVDLNSTDGPKQSAAAGALVGELNKVLKGNSAYDSARFRDVKLSPETLALKAENPQGEDLIRLNRLLLEDAYGLRKKNQVNAISARFSPDGKRLAAVLTFRNDDGQEYECVRIFEAGRGKPVANPESKDFDFAPGVFGGLVTSIDSILGRDDLGVTYAGRYRNKDDTGYSLRLSWKNGEVVGAPRDHHHAVDGVRFSPDGKQFVTTCEDGLVRFWETIGDDPASTSVSLKLEAPPRLAQFSPDGTQLLIVTEDPATLGAEIKNHFVQIYSTGGVPAFSETIKYKGQMTPASAEVDETVLGISPDKDRIVKKLDRSAVLSDAKTGKALGAPLPMELEFGDQGEITFARFSPDGKRFVTGVGAHAAVAKGFARLWDGNDGRALSEPLRHDRSVIDAVFSSDGQRFLTIAGRRESGIGYAARLWDAQTSRSLGDAFPESAFEVHIGITTSEFLDDGSRVRLISQDDEQAQVWDVGFPSNGRAPEWLSSLARLVGGYELNQKSGIIGAVPNRLEGLSHLREQLAKSAVDDPYTDFGKWVLSDPATRSISPYSKGSRSSK